MASKSKELGGMALEYMKDYMRIMVQVEAYLNDIFPEAYSDGCMKIYIERVLNYVCKALGEKSDAMWNTDYLVNPIYPCL